jgi:CubicO group peptidase (beta-lactamase class C family)
MTTAHWLYAASSLLVSLSTARAQSPVSETLDNFIGAFAKAGHFSGVVLVARQGKPVYEKAFGFANAEHRVPNRIDTRIGVASITKPMTAVIVRRLVEEGRLSMNDPVSKFLPDFPGGGKITVGLLYRHRSGIPHRVMPPEMETVPYTSAEMVERIKLAKLEFEPDSARLYSSAGYSVLARVLEIASGKRYAELLEQYVFRPAGMTSSVDFDSRALIERRADDYLLDEKGAFNAPAKDYSFLIGAGSVLSTARDIHAFAIALVTGTFGDSVRAGYMRDKVWWANGSTNGHRAEVRVNSEHNYSYAVVSNLNSGANDVVLQAINDIMQGKTIAAPVVPKPVLSSRPVALLPQYFGVYEREGGSRVEVTLKDETLFAGDVKLLPTTPDCFFEYKYYGDVCFVRDAARKIVHITWASPGFTSTWVKK